MITETRCICGETRSTPDKPRYCTKCKSFTHQAHK